MKIEIIKNADGTVWRSHKGAVVFEKNGTYFSMTDDQMKQMKELIEQVLNDGKIQSNVL